MEHTRIALDQIKPHPDNARQGDIDAIRESLRKHGQYRPLIVQRSSMLILAGNQTYAAMRAEKTKEADVVLVDVDDAQARSILVADNRIGELGGYDEKGLAKLVLSLDTIDGTGYDAESLELLVRESGYFGDQMAADLAAMGDDAKGEVKAIADRVNEERVAMGLPEVRIGLPQDLGGVQVKGDNYVDLVIVCSPEQRTTIMQALTAHRRGMPAGATLGDALADLVAAP